METNEFNITAIEGMKIEAFKQAQLDLADPHSSVCHELGMIEAYNKVLRLLRKQGIDNET